MKLCVIEKGNAIFGETSCLILPYFKGETPQDGVALTDPDKAALEKLAKGSLLKGGVSDLYFLPTPSSDHSGILTLGLGERDELDAETLRRAAGAACKILSEQRITHVLFDGAGAGALPVEAFVEGIMLGQYVFDVYKKVSDEPKILIDEITIFAGSAEASERLREGCERTVIICQNVNWARDLANMPPNHLTPTALAAQAQEISDESGCDCTILDEQQMADLGMNALLAVSKGAAEEAKLILLHYTHPEAENTLAIVGKGITFDTGGISIKPSQGMEEMKFDMCGAAAVLGAMRSLCELKPKINIVCVVPTSENKTGAEAYLPGDIIRAYNGKTIEIHSTDAEGRMVLADALAYAIEKYSPDAIVDAATLTGACVVALGHYAAGLMSNNADLSADLQLAAEASGERLWPLPLWKDYARLMEGNHADLNNTGPRGEAGAITAGCFLQEFVGDTPWAHLDIAGVAWGGKHISYWDPNHATGFGVRLLTQWIIDMASKT